MGIFTFKGKYDFLALDYPCEIEYEGIVYPNALAAFAACRFNSEGVRRKLVNAESDALYYTINNIREGVLLVPYFHLEEFEFLYKILCIKFKNNELRERLMETGEEHIIFLSRRERVLGSYKGYGSNLLGKALMRTRVAILNEII